MKAKVKFQEEKARFIESFVEVTDDNETWYHIPFCFKKVGKDTYELYGVNEAPVAVQKVVEEANKILSKELMVFEAQDVCKHKHTSYVKGKLVDKDHRGEEWTIQCTGYFKCDDCGRVMQIESNT